MSILKPMGDQGKAGDFAKVQVEFEATEQVIEPVKKKPLRLAPRRDIQAPPITPPVAQAPVESSPAIKNINQAETEQPSVAPENTQLNEQLKANTRTCPFCEELNAKKLTFCWSCDMPLFKGVKKSDGIKSLNKSKIAIVGSSFILLVIVVIGYFVPVDGLSLYRKHKILAINNELSQGKTVLTEDLLEGGWVSSSKGLGGLEMYIKFKKEGEKWKVKQYRVIFGRSSKILKLAKNAEGYFFEKNFYFDEYIIESVKEHPGVLLLSRCYNPVFYDGVKLLDPSEDYWMTQSLVLYKVSDDEYVPEDIKDAWSTFVHVVRQNREVNIGKETKVDGADLGGTLAMGTKGGERLVRFTQVYEGRAAANSKIKVGDALIELNGRKITNLRESTAEIWHLPVGEKVNSKIKRDGKIYSVNINIKPINKHCSSAGHRCYKHDYPEPDRIYEPDNVESHQKLEYPFMLWWR
jgi:hypothetical protein